MRSYLRPGTWAAMIAAVFVCLLAGASPTGAAPTAQPDLKPTLLTDPVPDPHQDGVLYFPQTGHTLRGPFLRYWQEYGGLAQFGYPLTEEFFEPSGPDNAALQVQYFERNRFELHPENAGTPHEVLLGTLGRDFRPQDPPAPQQPDTLYFPETGHNLSGKFREYWEAHGALAIHGYPITEAAMERSTDGKDYLVQWFERSRFELHPENAESEYEVLLGLLGGQLSEEKGYLYGWYPLYGRAVDWSWVAGVIRRHMPGSNCELMICGCVLLRYANTREQALQLVRATNPNLAVILRAPWPDEEPIRQEDNYGYGGTPFTVFGRLALQDEPYLKCPAEPTRRGYLVGQFQDNPAR